MKITLDLKMHNNDNYVPMKEDFEPILEVLAKVISGEPATFHEASRLIDLKYIVKAIQKQCPARHPEFWREE